ncbi:MAG: sigma-70 family RNA polymerase sigma factor [Christensenellales bacterium]|jgi:RNA polymerase primary sigma factor
MKKRTNEELCALAKDGDKGAVESILKNNIGFLRAWANQFSMQYGEFGVEDDDLIQEGRLALVEAIGGYDSDTGYKYLTYAGKSVRNRMYRYCMRQRSLYTRTLKKQTVVSLSAPVSEDDHAPLYSVTPDLTAELPEQAYIRKEAVQELHEALDGIGGREREYLLYRYGFHDGMEHPRIDTAVHFRISDSRAEIQEKKSLSDIRHELWVVIPEKRFASAEDMLTKLLVSVGELHAVELRLKSRKLRGKRITAAVYEYIADYDGTWGELRFDLVKDEAEVVALADNDTIKSRKFAVRAMEHIDKLDRYNLPERITLTFI